MVKSLDSSISNKSEKVTNTYGSLKDLVNDQHNLPREVDGEGWLTELVLPLAPSDFEQLVITEFPTCRKSTIQVLCLMVDELHKISRKQKNGKDCFEVSAAWAEQFLRRVGKRRPLRFLRDIGLIEKYKPHRASIRKKAITYRFKITTFKSYKLKLCDKALRKTDFYGQRSQNRRNKDPIFSWINYSLNLIKLGEEDQKDYLSRPDHSTFAKKFSKGERSQKWNSHYRWNSICNMPKDLREKLIFNDHAPAMLLDISCSFGVMLPWLFSDDTENLYHNGIIGLRQKMERDEECQKLRKFLSSDDFYEKLLPQKSRKEAKDAFQRFLNSPEPDALAQALHRSFKNLFPECSKMITRRRSLIDKSRKKRTPQIFLELHGRQSEIIDAVILKCRDHSIPCIPVSDELVVPSNSSVQVRTWIQEEIYVRTGVRAKVGGRRYQKATTPTPCPDGYCPECWVNIVAYKIDSPFPCRHQVKQKTEKLEEVNTSALLD